MCMCVCVYVCVCVCVYVCMCVCVEGVHAHTRAQGLHSEQELGAAKDAIEMEKAMREAEQHGTGDNADYAPDSLRPLSSIFNQDGSLREQELYVCARTHVHTHVQTMRARLSCSPRALPASIPVGLFIGFYCGLPSVCAFVRIRRVMRT
jgi:hypothetical protein